MLFRYISFHYIKNLLIILFALTGLFAGLDFLMNGTSLQSFNLKVLYIFNKWQESLNLLYPLAIIFGAIWTKIIFVKRNNMGALYALGATRKEVAQPFLLVAFLTYIFFVALNFTSFATAKDTAKALKKNEYHIRTSENLFFKYNESFVYIGKLLPYEKKLEKLTVFTFKDKKIDKVQSADSATYNGKEWLALNVTQKTKRVKESGEPYLTVEHMEQLNTLVGYNPKILTSIYEERQLTLYESLIAKELLSSQGIGTFKVRSDIYGKIIMPLFSIALLMILLFTFPFHARYMNVGSVTIKALGGTLFVWGILFALHQMGTNGGIPPEVGTVAPILLLWLYALYTFSRVNRLI